LVERGSDYTTCTNKTHSHVKHYLFFLSSVILRCVLCSYLHICLINTVIFAAEPFIDSSTI
jgi:hypothetical protein